MYLQNAFIEITFSLAINAGIRNECIPVILFMNQLLKTCILKAMPKNSNLFWFCTYSVTHILDHILVINSSFPYLHADPLNASHWAVISFFVKAKEK